MCFSATAPKATPKYPLASPHVLDIFVFDRSASGLVSPSGASSASRSGFLLRTGNPLQDEGSLAAGMLIPFLLFVHWMALVCVAPVSVKLAVAIFGVLFKSAIQSMAKPKG